MAEPSVRYLLPVVVFAGTWFMTRLVRSVALRRRMLDRPNERSAHIRPTPRLGGVGIMAAFLPALAGLTFVVDGGAVAVVVVLAVTFISGVGLWDDLRSLSARTRLAAQTLAATAVVVVAWDRLPSAWFLFGWSIPHVVVGMLSVTWVVWVTNLYNFMDGIDGLAAGQAVLAGLALGIAGAVAGATLASSASLALVGAAFGFLTFNFPPASIFMGDVGSTAIGFFFACVPFLSERGEISIETVAIALALFILDATVTLIRRMARGERLSQAHRSHFYQRPLALGLGHRSITLTAYAGMVIVASLAVSANNVTGPVRIVLIGAAVLLFGVYAGVISVAERRRVATTPRA